MRFACPFSLISISETRFEIFEMTRNAFKLQQSHIDSKDMGAFQINFGFFGK